MKKPMIKITNALLSVKKYFRPTEVDTLVGSYAKAKRILKWSPTHDINSLVDDMIDYEYSNLR